MLETSKTADAEENPQHCGIRLRVYPTRKQLRLAGNWMHLAHKFHNEAVAFLKTSRKQRWVWIQKHPALSRDWIPEEFAGSDTSAASKWLTGRLKKARAILEAHGGVQCPKNSIGLAVHHLSSGEIREIEDAWLLGIPRTCLDQVLQDMKKTVSKAISDRQKKSKKSAGFPDFHRWQHSQSVRFQVNPEKHNDLKNHWDIGEPYIPGLGRLKFRDNLDLPKTTPGMITLSRNAANQYHISFLCAPGEGTSASWTQQALPLDAQGLPKTNGFDLSLSHVAVDTDGKKLGRKNYLKRCKNKLKKASQGLSRKKHGSGHWKKQARQVGKLHVAVANEREHDLRAHAKEVVKYTAIICMEDNWAIAFLLQNHCLSASAQDAGLGMFRRFVNEEAAKLGHLVLKCERFDASSKTCSACGHIYKELTLAERTWTCAMCHALHDRDENAAVNIRVMALKKAIADLSSAPEMGAQVLSSHRLHPDLEASIARGDLTALLELFSRESHQKAKSVLDLRVDETRILPVNPLAAVGNGC